MASFSDYKKALEFAILDVVGLGMQDKRLSEKDTEQIKAFVSDNLANVKTPEELINFLERLAKAWSIFNYLLAIEKGKLLRDKSMSSDNDEPEESNVFTKKWKYLEDAILDIIIRCLKENSLNKEDSQPIARYVLDNLYTAKTQEQLIKFLKGLVLQWPIFKPLLSVEEGKEDRKHEVEAAAAIAQTLKSGNVKQALQMADKAIHN